MQKYLPEGLYAPVTEWEDLKSAANTGEILQSVCTKCDEFHNLHIRLGKHKGIIPREETALGISGRSVADYVIVSRVGKPICFQVLTFDNSGTAILSRKAAQKEAKDYLLNTLRPGDIIQASVQNPTQFGAFCDIGCGFIALMRIDRCCVSRLQSTAQLYTTGQQIHAAILRSDPNTGKIELTGRELLGTWNENAQQFRHGQSVTGTVRSIMPYGIFIELTPNLSGLAEYQPGFSTGDNVSVYIRSIQEEKHKIKLTILEKLTQKCSSATVQYSVSEGHLDKWEYFPGSRAVTYF